MISSPRRLEVVAIIITATLVLAACATTKTPVMAAPSSSSPCGEHLAVTVGRIILGVGIMAGSLALGIVGGPWDVGASLGSTALFDVGGGVVSTCIPDSGVTPTPPDETTP